MIASQRLAVDLDSLAAAVTFREGRSTSADFEQERGKLCGAPPDSTDADDDAMRRLDNGRLFMSKHENTTSHRVGKGILIFMKNQAKSL